MLLGYVGIVFKATSCFDLSRVMFHMAQIHRGNRQSRRSTVDFLGKKTYQVLIILPRFYDMMIVPIGDSPRWGKRPPSNRGDPDVRQTSHTKWRPPIDS